MINTTPVTEVIVNPETTDSTPPPPTPQIILSRRQRRALARMIVKLKTKKRYPSLLRQRRIKRLEQEVLIALETKNQGVIRNVQPQDIEGNGASITEPQREAVSTGCTPTGVEG